MGKPEFAAVGNTQCAVTWFRLIALCVVIFACLFVVIDNDPDEHSSLSHRWRHLTRTHEKPVRVKKPTTPLEIKPMRSFCSAQTAPAIELALFPVHLDHDGWPTRQDAEDCTWKDATDTKPAFPMCTYSVKEDPYISKSIQENGQWGFDRLRVTRDACLRPPTPTGRYLYIDVGANLGQHTVLAALRGYDVIAIEPVKETVVHMLRTLERNKISVLNDEVQHRTDATENKDEAVVPGVVTVLQTAVSDKVVAKTPFHVDRNNPGASTFVNSAGSEETEVDTINLDLLISKGIDATKIQMIKISAEHYDARVLNGMKEILQTGRIPFVLMTFQTSAVTTVGCDSFSLIAAMRDAGYRLWRFNQYFVTDAEIRSLLQKFDQWVLDALFVGPDTEY